MFYHHYDLPKMFHPFLAHTATTAIFILAQKPARRKKEENDDLSQPFSYRSFVEHGDAKCLHVLTTI